MSKIIKFPNRSGDEREAEELDFRQLDREQLETHRQSVAGGGWTFWNMARVLLNIVRLPVFLVLYFFRAPVMLLCSVLYLPLFLLASFAGYAFPEKPQMWGSFGVVSFVSFVLMYLYDLILGWLSPQELVRTL